MEVQVHTVLNLELVVSYQIHIPKDFSEEGKAILVDYEAK